MAERYLSRNVRKETRAQYIKGWPLGADARRHLILKYSSPAPESEPEIGLQERRDIWKEIADIVLDKLGGTEDKKGIDVGVSSGYFFEKLLEKGYKGKLLGVDIETVYLPFLEDFLSRKYNADVLLGGANAQSLRQIAILDAEGRPVKLEKIPANSFDFLTELFVLYHIEEPHKALSAAHRVLKPGGLAIFSGRGETHQEHLWRIGAITGDRFNAKAPDSFYSHYPLKQMEQDLEASEKFKIIYKGQQADHLWIPSTEDDWIDYRLAILGLLPLMINKDTGKPLVAADVRQYLDNEIRWGLFESQAAKNGGYFIDYVHQGYFVCEAVK